MLIKELDPGQSHTFGLFPLRVEITGAPATGVVRLMAVDQAGHESVTVRLTDTEVVLTPQPRRLRIVAEPVGGGSFPGGLRIGLAIRNEVANVASEQVLVSAIDVGALSSHEIAVLEFAADRSI